MLVEHRQRPSGMVKPVGREQMLPGHRRELHNNSVDPNTVLRLTTKLLPGGPPRLIWSKLFMFQMAQSFTQIHTTLQNFVKHSTKRYKPFHNVTTPYNKYKPHTKHRHITQPHKLNNTSHNTFLQTVHKTSQHSAQL